MSGAVVIIDTPQSNDVLCGQDATYGQHPGNTLLREQLEGALGAYRRAKDRRDKILLINGIIKCMRETYNSRFVRLSDDPSQRGWIQVSEQSVRDKVSHALRFATRKQQKIDGGLSIKRTGEHKKQKTIKTPTMKKSRRRKPLNKCDVSWSLQPQDELDAHSRAYVEKLYLCQQRILRTMMMEDEEEKYTDIKSADEASTSSSQMSVDPDPSSNCSTTSIDWQLEAKLQQELAYIEPIPFHTVQPHEEEDCTPTELSLRSVSFEEMEICTSTNVPKTNTMKKNSSDIVSSSSFPRSISTYRNEFFHPRKPLELRSDGHYEVESYKSSPTPFPLPYYYPPSPAHEPMCGTNNNICTPPPSPHAYHHYYYHHHHHAYNNNERYVTGPPPVFAPSSSTMHASLSPRTKNPMTTNNTKSCEPSSPPSVIY